MAEASGAGVGREGGDGKILVLVSGALATRRLQALDEARDLAPAGSALHRRRQPSRLAQRVDGASPVHDERVRPIDQPVRVTCAAGDEGDEFELGRLGLLALGEGALEEGVVLQAVEGDVADLARAPADAEERLHGELPVGRLLGVRPGERGAHLHHVAQVDGLGGVVHRLAGHHLALKDLALHLRLDLATPIRLRRVVVGRTFEESLRIDERGEQGVSQCARTAWCARARVGGALDCRLLRPPPPCVRAPSRGVTCVSGLLEDEKRCADWLRTPEKTASAVLIPSILPALHRPGSMVYLLLTKVAR